jgi:hypothetical protein
LPSLVLIWSKIFFSELGKNKFEKNFNDNRAWAQKFNLCRLRIVDYNKIRTLRRISERSQFLFQLTRLEVVTLILDIIYQWYTTVGKCSASMKVWWINYGPSRAQFPKESLNQQKNPIRLETVVRTTHISKPVTLVKLLSHARITNCKRKALKVSKNYMIKFAICMTALVGKVLANP